MYLVNWHRNYGAIAGGAAGFVGGALGATLHGANLSQIGRSAMMGARAGAIAGAVAGGINWAGGQYQVAEVVSKMAGAGLSSAANGGNFERNFQSVVFAGFGYSAHKAWNSIATKDGLELQGGPRGGLLGEAKGKTPYQDPYVDNNNMGFQGSKDTSGMVLPPPSPSEARFYLGFDEGSLGSRLGNLIPGIADVSVVHDYFQTGMSGLSRELLNVPGMFLAAGITYAGYIDVAPTSVVMDQVNQ